MDLARINLLILDVDGVLTDGRVAPAADGNATKFFHAQDGYAIRVWLDRGGQAAILSGRADETVRRRAVELGIDQVLLGMVGKLAGYETILASAGLADEAVAYIGDDLPDLEPMERCAFPVAVADAVPAVKRVAMYVTRRAGGRGAVAEVIELLLRKSGRWRHGLPAAQ